MKDGRTRSFKVISWAIWLQTMAHRLWAIIYWSIILTWSFWKQTFVINSTKSSHHQTIRAASFDTIWTINITAAGLFHTWVRGTALCLMTYIPTISTVIGPIRCRTPSKSGLRIRTWDAVSGRTTIPVTWFRITITKIKISIDWATLDAESATAYNLTLMDHELKAQITEIF